MFADPLRLIVIFVVVIIASAVLYWLGRPSQGQVNAGRGRWWAPSRFRFLNEKPRRTRPARTVHPVVKSLPYAFARKGPAPGSYLDRSHDARAELLQARGLPVLRTPLDLADWLQLPLGQLAWLGRITTAGRSANARQAHYHFVWLKKRSGGFRLLEVPKADLKRVQQQILRKILDRLPPAPAAQGFAKGRSIWTHAAVHAGQAIVLKFDLRNFYAAVRYPRVVAVFHRLGFSSEVSLWLARLTTSRVPENLPFPEQRPFALWEYRSCHLPQGAPTSPALANLSAYWLDRRLAALAASWGLRYSRYADDLTFSGSAETSPKLFKFIQLVQQIIRAEGFRSNRRKRQVLRAHQRQTVTGLVVNSRPQVARKEVDLLKATLHNCVQRGPSSQNRTNHPAFAEHLRGRIAHVGQQHPQRAARLSRLFAQIDWNR
jgi:RNA-directed DNA polymerase